MFGRKWTKRAVLEEQRTKNSAILCLTDSPLPGIIHAGDKNGPGGVLWKSGRRSLRGKGVGL